MKYTIYIVTQEGDLLTEDHSTIESADDSSDAHDDEGSVIYWSYMEALDGLDRMRKYSQAYKDKVKSWVNNP